MKTIITLFLIAILFTCAITQDGVRPEDVKVQSQTILIKKGTVVNFDGEQNADVLIQNGKIVKVQKDIEAPKGARIIDAKGKYVMPGGIDPHVHMELPFMGTVSKDDFYTGTAAALSGGTTMILDFAIPQRGESMIKTYEKYLKKGEKAASDYGLHMGVTEWNDKVAKELEYLAKEKGINSFKCFMAYKGVFQLTDDDLFAAMKKASELGVTVMVHAENGDIVAEGQKRMKELGITGPEGHVLSRPSEVEAEAVHRAAVLANKAGVPLYVVHVMSKDAMEEVLRAKLRGWRIIGEPILSGLMKNNSDYWNKDWNKAARIVMSPPIRGEEDRIALGNALQNKVLDLVGTDHCVFSMEQKRMGKDDFTKIPNGVNGVENRMGLLWSKFVHTGRLRPSDYVRVTSTEAAQIFNIFPRKGAIREGSDADVIILNPEKTKIISAKTQHQNIEYNIYEGWEQHGDIEMTISRGVIVWENGKLNAVKGAGRFVYTPPYGKLFDGLKNEIKERTPTAVKRD